MKGHSHSWSPARDRRCDPASHGSRRLVRDDCREQRCLYGVQAERDRDDKADQPVTGQFVAARALHLARDSDQLESTGTTRVDGAHRPAGAEGRRGAGGASRAEGRCGLGRTAGGEGDPGAAGPSGPAGPQGLRVRRAIRALSVRRGQRAIRVRRVPAGLGRPARSTVETLRRPHSSMAARTSSRSRELERANTASRSNRPSTSPQLSSSRRPSMAP